LRKQYKFEYVAGHPGETRNGKFFKRAMMPHMIFDLSSKVGGS
jgi:hypothetical protein